MTLTYIDANKDGVDCQFSFFADFLDVLRKPDKIRNALKKQYPEITFGEITLEKSETKEINIKLTEKDGKFQAH